MPKNTKPNQEKLGQARLMTSLLWRRAVANSSPEVREMLRAYNALSYALLNPDAATTHDELLGLTMQAQRILSDGFTCTMLDSAETAPLIERLRESSPR